MGVLWSKLFNGETWPNLDDFDAAAWDDGRPAEEDRDVYEAACARLQDTPALLEQLTNYKPCSDNIRLAMNDPDDQDLEEQAFQAVTKNAVIIAGFWRFSKELESLVPDLLSKLAAPDDGSEPVVSKPALAMKLAEVFQFVLRFDELKMLRPGLQNDFSFYRRSLSKHAQDADLEVRDDDASFISLFLAAHIPMMTALSKAVAARYNEDEEITNSVAHFCNSMAALLMKGKHFPADSKHNLLAVRAMVGAVVLFDHVEPEGAFHKRSPVNINGVCKMLVRDFRSLFPSIIKEANLMGLISAVKYSSMHFSDDSTPDSVADLLDN